MSNTLLLYKEIQIFTSGLNSQAWERFHRSTVKGGTYVLGPDPKGNRNSEMGEVSMDVAIGDRYSLESCRGTCKVKRKEAQGQCHGEH